MFRRTLPILLLFLGAGLVRGQRPPGWWDDPVREDSVNVFQTGTHARAESPAAAENGAVANALDQFALRLVPDRDSPLFPGVRAALRGWNLHAKHEASSGSGHTAWVILRLPKAELDRLSRWLVQGDEWFAEARQRLEAGDRASALTLLERILDTYPPGGQTVYDPGPALLLFASSLEAEGRFKEAMDRYQLLARTTSQGETRRLALEGFNRSRQQYNPLADALSAYAGKTFQVRGEWQSGGEVNLNDLRQSLRGAGLVEASPEGNPQLELSTRVDLGRPVERNTFGVVLYQATGSADVTLLFQGAPVYTGTLPFSVSSRSPDAGALQLAAAREVGNRILLVLQENKP